MSYQLADGVQVVALEHEGCLINPTNNTFYTLRNDTGCQLMALLGLAKEKHCGVAVQTLIAYFTTFFDAHPARASDDLEGKQGILSYLKDQGLVREGPFPEYGFPELSWGAAVKAQYHKPEIQAGAKGEAKKLTQRDAAGKESFTIMGWVKVLPKIAVF
jgi:hypothetical protein